MTVSALTAFAFPWRQTTNVWAGEVAMRDYPETSGRSRQEGGRRWELALFRHIQESPIVS